MPAAKRDPEVLYALREQSQIIKLQTAQIQRLVEEQKAFVDSLSLLVGGMVRRWDAAIETVQSRDVALAQFELEVLKRLGIIHSRQPDPDACGIAAIRRDLDRLNATIEVERRGHVSALDCQRETKGKLQASMVLYDRAA